MITPADKAEINELLWTEAISEAGIDLAVNAQRAEIAMQFAALHEGRVAARANAACYHQINPFPHGRFN